MSTPITGMSGTLVDARTVSGSVSEGPPVSVVPFEEQSSVTVSHNRHRDLLSVKVLVVSVEYGEDDPPLEELNVALFDVTYTDVDNFTVTFDHAYTGEIRFY